MSELKEYAEKKKYTFMNEVMRVIWTNESEEYTKCYNIAMDMEISDLSETIYLMTDMPMYEEEYRGGMCALVTTGCGYHIQNGHMSGCSMCNLHNSPKLDAYMAVLRKRDVCKYAWTVKQIYLKSKGVVDKRTYKEYWLSCCFLGDDQMPLEAYRELFGEKGIILKRPIYHEFETSVASVRYEKIKQLESFVGKKGLIFRLGIEYGSEYIRQIWINKPVTNLQIKEAIDICHSMGHKVTANVIFGIPALGEEASLKEFIHTMQMLEDYKADFYSISILYRDPKTLQGLVYERLSEDEVLRDKGLASGKHTGLPWLFTVLRGFEWIFRNIPNYRERCGLGNFDPRIVRDGGEVAYNNRRDCRCYKETYEALRRFAFYKDIKPLQELFANYSKDECYTTYKNLLEQQEGDACLEMLCVGKGLSKAIWNEDWIRWYKLLADELKEGYKK